MERTSSGQQRRPQLRTNNVPEFRNSGTDVPAGTAASARSTQALRCLTEVSAFSTLIRQRPPTPSCGGQSPYRGENSGPGRRITESLTSNPRIREQPRLTKDSPAMSPVCPLCPQQQTFEFRCPLSRDFVRFTSRSRLSWWCRRRSVPDPERTLKRVAFDVRQRPLTPSCRGLRPYCGENSEPGRHITESLTSNPRVREQPGPQSDIDEYTGYHTFITHPPRQQAAIRPESNIACP